MTTVNNALDPISTLSNPNIYTLLAETATPRSTLATARFYTGALDEVFSSGTLRIRDVRNSDPRETCWAEFQPTVPRVTILFRNVQTDLLCLDRFRQSHFGKLDDPKLTRLGSLVQYVLFAWLICLVFSCPSRLWTHISSTVSGLGRLSV